MKTKTYSELIRLPTFEERFRYLKLGGRVGDRTFGAERYLNQSFYRSIEWKKARDMAIIRDGGLDLGCEGHEIGGRIIVHHINPITIEHIHSADSLLLDPENLICMSELTHNALHYSDEDLLPKGFVERKPFDTCPWIQT